MLGAKMSLRGALRPALRASPVSPLRARVGLSPLIARRSIFDNWGVPQPPGNIVGTVNDAVKVPEPHPVHGSYHWGFERIVAAAIVPLTIYPFAVGGITPVVDALFGGLLVVHTHIGFDACVTDYFPARKFPRGNGVLMGLLYLASAGSLYGIYKLETEHEGLSGTIQQIWTA